MKNCMDVVNFLLLPPGDKDFLSFRIIPVARMWTSDIRMHHAQLWLIAVANWQVRTGLGQEE